MGCALLTIVADENIPFVDHYFSHLGKITRVSGRELSAEQVKHADILLVRSVTHVNQALLEHSRVKFVGTATIGIDHLDVGYLEAAGIAWANAPACNAHSVVDYVLSCFCRFDGLWAGLLSGLTVGIVGLGNVGSRLQCRLTGLGVKTKAYDPLLVDSIATLYSFDEVLACDVICLHTPITKDGEFPTYHMFSRDELNRLKPDALLINAGRGEVIDNVSLQQFIAQAPSQKFILDVWEKEPSINLDLMALVSLATPHIAGYSLDGKISGTEMIYSACCKALALEPQISTGDTEPLTISVPEGLDPVAGLCHAISQVYNVSDDDGRFREAMNSVKSEAGEPAKMFDKLRKFYPERREFSCYQIENSEALGSQLRLLLSGAGFQLPG